MVCERERLNVRYFTEEFSDFCYILYMPKKHTDNSNNSYGRKNAPLISFAVLTAIFLGAGGFFLYLALITGIPLQNRFTIFDMLLLVIATHKVAWLISKDEVLSFVRAPFVRFRGWSYPGAAMHEEARGTGMQFALGELLLCPWCVGMWVAAYFVISFLFFPDITRVIAIIFTVLMMSDFLHIFFIKAGAWMKNSPPDTMVKE